MLHFNLHSKKKVRIPAIKDPNKVQSLNKPNGYNAETKEPMFLIFSAEKSENSELTNVTIHISKFT